MPTTIAALSQDSITLRFKEPYVSRGLNQKLFGIIGSGVVRGGKLATTGAGFGVYVLKDPTEGDMIFSYQDANGLQFTIRLSATETLNLAPFANTTIYICLYVEYAIGVTTVVEWRKYTEAEMLAAPDVIVLGKVVVPAAGPIPAANVTPTARRMAWDDKAPEGWHPCVKNGGFEQAVAAGSADLAGEVEHWYGLEVGQPFYQISTTAPYSGTREFHLEQTIMLPLTQKIFRQSRRVRVKPGQYVRGRVRLRGLTWNAGNPIDAAGHQGMALLFYDNDFALVGGTSWIENNALTGTFAYTLLDGIVEVPASAAWMCVSVGVNNNGALLGVGSLYFDDVKVWVESEHPIEDIFDLAELSESTSAEVLSLIPFAADLPVPVTMAEHIARTLRVYKSGQTGGPVENVIAHLVSELEWRLRLFNGTLAAKACELETGEYTYTTPRAKTIPISIWAFQGAQALNYILAGGGDPSAAYSVEIGTNSTYLLYELDKHLRDGMTITDFSVVVNPGAARVSGVNIVVDLVKVDVNFAAPAAPVPAIIASAEDDASTNLQTISPAPFSEAVVRDGAAGCSYYLRIKFGNDAGANSDLLYGIQINVTDAGPRN